MVTIETRKSKFGKQKISTSLTAYTTISLVAYNRATV